MTEGTSLDQYLAALADFELKRLRRNGPADLKTELSHHLWPFIKEMVTRKVRDTKMDAHEPVAHELRADGAARAIWLNARLLRRLAQLVRPDELATWRREAWKSGNELAGSVDPEEWNDLVDRISADRAALMDEVLAVRAR